MKNKEEKYYDYVINDLISKTEFNEQEKEIMFPFSWRMIGLPSRSYLTVHGMFDYVNDEFIKHIITKYGVHPSESVIIWFKYLNKLEMELYNRNMRWENN